MKLMVFIEYSHGSCARAANLSRIARRIGPVLHRKARTITCNKERTYSFYESYWIGYLARTP